MNVTSFAVRNYSFTLVAALGLAAAGTLAFLRIPRSEDPAISPPFYQIYAVQPGATPQDMEKLVARPLEDSLQDLDDIDTIRSTIRAGLAVVRVEFVYGVDTDRKYDDVIRQVNQVRAELPALQALDVLRMQTANTAVIQAALVSETMPYGKLQDLAEEIERRLETVAGVRRVDRDAFPDKQVRVELDLDRMKALGLTFSRVAEAIAGDNSNISAGAVESGARRFTLKTTGPYETIEEVGETPLAGDGEAVVRVKDLATVQWDTAENEYFGRFNGRRALFLTVVPQRDRNVLPIRNEVVRILDEIRPSLPGGVRLETGFDQTLSVRERLGRLRHDFLIALGLVLLTVLPLGFRSSLLVMVSIPLSLAIGFIALSASGCSLNQLSIVGMVISLGLLVDDSIVVVENISRFRRNGMPAIDAAIAATRQITLAVLGTTASLLLAFLPLLLLPGGPGEFIRSLPLAVVYTVSASLLVSLTIVPFLASRALRSDSHAAPNRLLRALEHSIETLYRPLLHFAMRHRALTLAISGALVLATVALVPRIGFSLFPKAGARVFAIRIEAAESASLAETDRVVRAAEAILAASPEVSWWFANVGRHNPQVYYNEVPRPRKANEGEIVAGLRHLREKDMPAFMERLRAEVARIPGARVVLKEYENGPPVIAPIEVRIFGEDLDGLATLAAKVESLLAATPGTIDVDNPLRRPRTDLRVRVDKQRANLLGVTEPDLDRAVALAASGLPVAMFREEDGDEWPVQLVLSKGERATLDHWPALAVPNRAGTWLPVSQVASLELESTPPLIERYNRQRMITVSCQVRHGHNTDKITREVARQLAESGWFEHGFRHEFGGEVESRKESFSGLGGAVLLAAFGILGVLVLEFRSFRGVLVVATVIPLGIAGGLAALWLTGSTISFTAAVGFIALTGIEIKNSILLVDFTNQLRARGVPLDEAIEQAGQTRFLPVVLTTLTALGALLPLALQGSSLYSPLAFVIIGGLVSSLLLSRLVTPVAYSLLAPPLESKPGSADDSNLRH